MSLFQINLLNIIIIVQNINQGERQTIYELKTKKHLCLNLEINLNIDAFL